VSPYYHPFHHFSQVQLSFLVLPFCFNYLSSNIVETLFMCH
jgi:hypothetical protein